MTRTLALKPWPDAVTLFAVVTTAAFVMPFPWWPTDRHFYERIGRELIVPGCSDLHCFRPLVPWVLGLVPGPTIFAWKIYASICQTLAGLAMAQWCSRFGASRTAARQCAWLTALGSGACYTLFDSYTADPLMHALAPTLMLLLDRARVPAATLVGAIGVLAKEFAAVPVVVSTVDRVIRRQWREAGRLAASAAVVVGVWVAWQVLARTVLGYSNGDSRSGELLSGGYLAVWLNWLNPSLVASVIVMAFGGVWLMWAGGLGLAPPELRSLAVAAIPAVLIFNIAQQPDRALWNFAFVVMPPAALVLSRVPPAAGWTFVAAQVMLNLRFGGQLPFAPPARISLAVSLVLAMTCVVLARRPSPSTVYEAAPLR